MRGGPARYCLSRREKDGGGTRQADFLKKGKGARTLPAGPPVSPSEVGGTLAKSRLRARRVSESSVVLPTLAFEAALSPTPTEQYSKATLALLHGRK